MNKEKIAVELLKLAKSLVPASKTASQSRIAEGMGDNEVLKFLEDFMDDDGVDAVDDAHDGIYNTRSQRYRANAFRVSGVIGMSYPHTSGYPVPGGSSAEKAYDKWVESNYSFLTSHLKRTYPDAFGDLREVTYQDAEDAGLEQEYEDAETELWSSEDDVIVVNLIGTYDERKKSIELYASVQIGDATRAAWAETVTVNVSKAKNTRDLRKLLEPALKKLTAKF
jgi:hypothetical protein